MKRVIYFLATVFFLLSFESIGQKKVDYNEKPNGDIEILKIKRQNSPDIDNPDIRIWNDTLWLYAWGKRYVLEDYLVKDCHHEFEDTPYRVKKPSGDNEQPAKFKKYEESEKDNLYKLLQCTKCGIIKSDAVEIEIRKRLNRNE